MKSFGSERMPYFFFSLSTCGYTSSAVIPRAWAIVIACWMRRSPSWTFGTSARASSLDDWGVVGAVEVSSTGSEGT